MKNYAIALLASLGVCQLHVATAVAQQQQLIDDINNAKALGQFVDSIIVSEMKNEHLPAVAFAMVHQDKVVYQKGFGISHLESNEPITVDGTLFRIGSISKVFTAIALTQLIDKGKVDLNDEVNQYLEPELQLQQDFDQPIRIWHLLTHTAGFDQKLRGRLFDNRENRPDIGEFLRGELTPIRAPGEISMYDTYGITLAGRIIENVSGQSFAEYLTNNIFTPLGMENSGVELGYENRQLATGYGLESGKHLPLDYELYVTTPASSIDATTTDMTKFMMAILGDGGQILTKKMAKKIKQPQYRPAPDFPGFSYGFWEDLSFGERAIQHGGIMNGYTSMMYLYPEHEIGFYFVYSRDFETGPDPRLRNILTRALQNRWFGQQEGDSPQQDEPYPVDSERFAGTYANTLYCHLCFEGEGASRRIFSLEAIGEGVIKFSGREYYATDPLKFVDATGDRKVVFKEDSNGEVAYAIANFGSDATYEKLGEPLLKKTLGANYSSEKASPLKAMTYRGMQLWNKAIVEYQKITALRPADGRAYYYLGFSLKNAERHEDAIQAFKASFNLGFWQSFNANTIAEIYLLSGNTAETYNWIRKMIELGKAQGEPMEEIRKFIFRNPVLRKLENDKKVLAILEDG